MNVPMARFRDASCWRIIPSRFPPVDLFRDVAPSEHWNLLNDLEGATNERLREAVGVAGFVRPEDKVESSSSHYIIGPLTHPSPDGSCFSDGSFGVVYAGLEFETALAEVQAQREEFLRRTHELPQRVDMRVIVLDLNGDLHDLRGRVPTDLAACRALARQLRESGSYGLVFDSKERCGGAGVCIFRPPVLSKVRQERHFAFVWDGQRIVDRIEYGPLGTQSTHDPHSSVGHR